MNLLIMELRFEAMLYSTSVRKILMWAISNVHAGRRFPTPGLATSITDKLHHPAKTVCFKF